MESSPANELQPLDWAVMGTYVVVVAAVCFLTARASQGAKQFFLADSAASALTVGAAFFASNIGSDSISEPVCALRGAPCLPAGAGRAVGGCG